MKSFIIFGTGDFSDIVANLIESDMQREVSAYVLDDEYIDRKTYRNKPVVPISRVEKLYPPSQYSVAIGFIGKKMFTQRKEKFKFFHEKKYELENLIHSSSVLTNCSMGIGNIIFENCVIGYLSMIGDCNIMWPLASINHHGQVGSFNNLSPSISTSGNVKIGNNCFIGNNSTYKNNIRIADYTFVGAGAYITKDTEEYGVYVPERTIKLNKSSFDFM